MAFTIEKPHNQPVSRRPKVCRVWLPSLRSGAGYLSGRWQGLETLGGPPFSLSGYNP